MNEAKHTPGPWHTTEAPSHNGVGVCISVFSEHPNYDTPTDGYIADVYGQMVGSQDCDRDRAEANAHLIAAAPDLLAACKAMMDETNVPKRLWQRVFDAIDKAEGNP